VRVGLALLSVICLTSAAGGLAHADDAELAQGRKLYSQGLTQEAAGDWAGALQSFEEVARVKMTPQVRFHIARCKEKLGRWNEALGGYRLAEYEAEGSEEIASEIAKARSELERKIPKLVIVRGKGAEAIKVELDGVALGETQIGSEISADPGPHVVTGVIAPGRKIKKQVTLAEGATARVVLDVPDEAAETPPTASEDTASVVAAEKDAPKKATNDAAPWILGGIGVTSLVLAGVFYKLRNDAENELDEQCIGNTCPDTLKDTESRGQTYAALSGITLGLGIVGIGAGALLLVSRSGSSEASSRYVPSVAAGPRGAGFSFRGSF
jgi:hypothetical protein